MAKSSRRPRSTPRRLRGRRRTPLSLVNNAMLRCRRPSQNGEELEEAAVDAEEAQETAANTIELGEQRYVEMSAAEPEWRRARGGRGRRRGGSGDGGEHH